jgi:hypothetical protein
MITEQDDIVKTIQKYILSGFNEELSKKISTVLPLIVIEDDIVQIDPRFTTHA